MPPRAGGVRHPGERSCRLGTVGPASSYGAAMRVSRIGFTPLKGGRHRTHGSVVLAEDGPVGDRVFCLVDPVADRCLRTVENPTLIRTSVTWDGGPVRG